MRGLIVGLAAGLTWTIAMAAGAAAAPAPGGQCKTVCSPTSSPAPAPGGQCKTVCSPTSSPAAAKGGLCKVICAPPPVTQAEPKTKPARTVKRVAVKPPAVKPHAVRPAPARRAARHRPHRYAERRDYYSYREGARDEEHGSWQQVPNDAMIPAPQAYGPPPYAPPPPPPGYYAEGYAQDYRQSGATCDCAARPGLEIDRHGWTGGVGYAGGGEVFVDGYGMVHYGSGRSLNGPTYNSYGQSFQFNPSRAAPFQPRVMGGFAPGARR